MLSTEVDTGMSSPFGEHSEAFPMVIASGAGRSESICGSVSGLNKEPPQEKLKNRVAETVLSINREICFYLGGKEELLTS